LFDVVVDVKVGCAGCGVGLGDRVAHFVPFVGLPILPRMTVRKQSFTVGALAIKLADGFEVQVVDGAGLLVADDVFAVGVAPVSSGPA
jgi:hypothetical protein